jgi:hypothetical protein
MGDVIQSTGRIPLQEISMNLEKRSEDHEIACVECTWVGKNTEAFGEK